MQCGRRGRQRVRFRASWARTAAFRPSRDKCPAFTASRARARRRASAQADRTCMNSKPIAVSGDVDTADMKRRSAPEERTLSAQLVPSTYSASRPRCASTARSACTWQPTPTKRRERIDASARTASSSSSELARTGLTPAHARICAAVRHNCGRGSIRAGPSSARAPTAMTASTRPDSSASIAIADTTPVHAAPASGSRMRTPESSVCTPK